MSWRVARSLDVLLAEINTVAPHRSKLSDGSIGDAAHASRDSDHNPWVIDSDGIGVVRARDFTHDPDGGLDCRDLAPFLAGLLGEHPAMRSGAYIIWDRRIISRDRISEGWRPYSGANPHDKHLHLSVALDEAGYDSTARWGWDTEEDPMAAFDRAELTEIIRSAVAKELEPIAEQLEAAADRERRLFTNMRVILRQRFGATDAQLDAIEAEVRGVDQ